MATGLSKGVEVRALSIRLRFVTADGTVHKERLTHEGKALPPTPANIKHANRLAVEIAERIACGTFSMAQYFPASGDAGAPTTVGEQLDNWLAAQRIEFATRKSYASSVKFWKAAPVNKEGTVLMGDLALRSLKHSQILTAVASKPGVSGKTVNNLMSVLRLACELAVADGALSANPTSEIKPAKHQRKPPDPFTAEEVERIVAELAERYDPQERNYFEFKFFTGLRSSEAIALRWPNVDFNRKEILVSEALVRGQAKDTKTHTARVVKLNSRAVEILKRQKAHTFLADEAVFHGPNHGAGWTDEKHVAKRCWKPTLKRLGIRYRVPYSTRHTYASLMLMAGMRPAFCARQMGHGLEMFIRVYARWLDGDSDDLEMARLERSMAERKGPDISHGFPTEASAGQVLPMKTGHRG